MPTRGDGLEPRESPQFHGGYGVCTSGMDAYKVVEQWHPKSGIYFMYASALFSVPVIFIELNRT